MSTLWTLAGRVAAGATILLAGGGATAPAADSGPATEWRRLQPGIELGERTFRAPGEGRWTRLVLLRLDPARVSLGLDAKLTPGFEHGDWTIDADGLAIIEYAQHRYGLFNFHAVIF